MLQALETRRFQGQKTPDELLFFACRVVLWSHHAARPLPLDGATVIVQVVVVVGCRGGHRKHAGHVELHVCKKTEETASSDYMKTGQEVRSGF